MLKNWEDIKQETKGQETYTDTLKSVPKVFPALMRAQKIGKRAKRAGMDFDSASDALKRLKSEISELEQALNNDDLDEISDELGDILFSCTNVARFLDLDAEEALQNSSDKFIRRFEKVEEQIKLDGIDMKSLGIDELDAYWHKAKRKN
ncbi:MAG: hypothetical protein GX896_10550 [Clostridiales bacterium]|nr:hypothetical protein [Clostridiales bacterium]